MKIKSEINSIFFMLDCFVSFDWLSLYSFTLQHWHCFFNLITSKILNAGFWNVTAWLLRRSRVILLVLCFISFVPIGVENNLRQMFNQHLFTFLRFNLQVIELEFFFVLLCVGIFFNWTAFFILLLLIIREEFFFLRFIEDAALEFVMLWIKFGHICAYIYFKVFLQNLTLSH